MTASVDVYSPHTIAPAVLTSSRPTTPHHPAVSSLAGPSSQPAHAFDPAAYLDFPDLAPPAFDPSSLGISPAATTSSGGATGAGGQGAGGLPFATGSMGMTRTGSNSSGGESAGGMRTRAKTGALPHGGGGGFVSFDPDDGGIDLDDVSDDEERAVEGRPRKRKSVRDLRGAAQSQGPSAAMAKDEGAVADEDKARRKISIEYIEDKSKRHITFSKRKAGIMKKAYELSTLTGTQVLLLVVSESGWVYTFTTDKFKPLVKEDENGQLSAGQRLIAACLEAKDGSPDLSAAYQSAASSTGNFEANSAVHGGQISLKTGVRARPLATNRRVSGRGRAHVPAAIQTGNGQLDPSLPCPPGSGGIPPVPQLPTPMSSTYLDTSVPLQSPISPRGPMSSGGSRSVSHGPISPARPDYSLQQQQQHAHAQQQQADYAEMMQRADLLHIQQQHAHQQQQQQQHQQGGGYGHDGGAYDLYGQQQGHHLYMQDLPLPPPPPHLQQHHGGGAHSHALHHQLSHDTLPQPPPVLQHARSFSLGGGGGGGGRGGPHTPQHRTLHHQASHGHLGGADYAADHYGGNGGGGGAPSGNYTHAPPVSSADPRQGGAGGQGWQTPQQHAGAGQASAQNTPVHAAPQALYAGGDDVYVR